MRYLILALAAAAVAGCAGGSSESIKDVDENARQVEIAAGESRTLAGLAKLEESVANYIQAERKVPPSLEDLIPKYLAAMPVVEIHVRGHRDTDKAQVYPSSILRGGQIDGTKLKDTGRWGYVFNDQRVVVFVDCTHRSSRGRAWYLERGVY